MARESTDATQRAEEERLARKKYAIQLARIIQEAKLPLQQQLAGVSQPEEVWTRIFGTRRSKTLRNRLKSWLPFRAWLECVHGVMWPTSIRDPSRAGGSDGKIGSGRYSLGFQTL